VLQDGCLDSNNEHLHSPIANDIYKKMVTFGPHMPKEMLIGSPEMLAQLGQWIASGRFR